MSESLYSTSEVARLFEINRVTIYRWVQEGVVKAYKVGKHLKIPASEVERLWKEFGFPGAYSIPVSDSTKKHTSRISVNNGVKGKAQKKLVMAVGSNEDDIRFIKKMFIESGLNKECTLTTYTDTLEAALIIGKEKPDLLVIRIMESDINIAEFVRKMKGIHADIKVIFTGASSTPDKTGETEIPYGISEIIGQVSLRREISKALGLPGRN